MSTEKIVCEKNCSIKKKDLSALKRVLRKQDDSAVPTDVLNELKCSVCGCLLLPEAGLVNHLKSNG